MKKIRHVRKCNHCGSTKDLIKTNFLIKYRIQYYMCNPCNTKRLRKYMETPNGRMKVNRAVYKSIKKFKYKQDARMQLNEAVKAGRIKKPKLCDECHLKKKLEGHHPDYAFPLKVKWLCKACHCKKHKRKSMKR
jgi:hypothetical protein